MESTSLMVQAFQLMLIGMGTVFIFLSILVVLTSGLHRLLLEPVIEQQSDLKTDLEQETVAAIATAVHQYRKTNNH